MKYGKFLLLAAVLAAVAIGISQGRTEMTSKDLIRDGLKVDLLQVVDIRFEMGMGQPDAFAGYFHEEDAGYSDLIRILSSSSYRLGKESKPVEQPENAMMIYIYYSEKDLDYLEICSDGSVFFNEQQVYISFFNHRERAKELYQKLNEICNKSAEERIKKI